jgi:hypothetical protein
MSRSFTEGIIEFVIISGEIDRGWAAEATARDLNSGKFLGNIRTLAKHRSADEAERAAESMLRTKLSGSPIAE